MGAEAPGGIAAAAAAAVGAEAAAVAHGARVRRAAAAIAVAVAPAHAPRSRGMLRRSQDRLKDLMPGGNLGGRGLVFGAARARRGVAADRLLHGPPQRGRPELLFGKFVGKTGQGLNYNWPTPIGGVIKQPVTNVITTEVGLRAVETVRRQSQRDALQESLMLTGDENIVDINAVVQWQVDPANPEFFAFNIQDPPGTVKAVAESAMREIIGRRNIQPILTTDRVQIENEVRQLMQETLDSYKAGVRINLVQLQKSIRRSRSSTRSVTFRPPAPTRSVRRTRRRPMPIASCRKRAVVQPR